MENGREGEEVAGEEEADSGDSGEGRTRTKWSWRRSDFLLRLFLPLARLRPPSPRS